MTDRDDEIQCTLIVVSVVHLGLLGLQNTLYMYSVYVRMLTKELGR